jgi:hypothetical protein
MGGLMIKQTIIILEPNEMDEINEEIGEILENEDTLVGTVNGFFKVLEEHGIVIE